LSSLNKVADQYKNSLSFNLTIIFRKISAVVELKISNAQFSKSKTTAIFLFSSLISMIKNLMQLQYILMDGEDRNQNKCESFFCFV
jgi:hypothetical protein